MIFSVEYWEVWVQMEQLTIILFPTPKNVYFKIPNKVWEPETTVFICLL